jgi:adenylosuccinate synthase
MRHVIVADLGYGDSGKGTVVDWLCSARGSAAREEAPVHAVVRFNGGAQAAHNVLTTDGRHHTFAQFGSCSFTPGVRTHLSRFMLVDPLALAAEAAHLASAGVGDALDRLTVDRDALLTTPYHQAANRARELARGHERHGSCGMGIGETARYALENPDDAPRAADCTAPRRLARSLRRLRNRLADELGFGEGPDLAGLCDAYRAFAARVALVDGGYLGGLLRAGPVVFEGAQGVLLDEWRGFHPYTTWSTTTFANAETLLAEAGQTAVRLGVVRCYMTRHGPGPFVTEDPTLEIPEPHNQNGAWQGAFRTGHFDAVALRYAVEVSGGVDAVALTHLDVAARHPLRVCRSYQVGGQRQTRIIPGPERDLTWQERLTAMLLRARPVYECPGPDWPDLVEDVLGAPVTLRSYGPTAAGKRAMTPAHVISPPRPAAKPAPPRPAAKPAPPRPAAKPAW